MVIVRAIGDKTLHEKLRNPPNLSLWGISSNPGIESEKRRRSFDFAGLKVYMRAKGA